MDQHLRPRFSERVVSARLAFSPIVLIHGPRQCGKTTLAQEIGEASGYEYRTFDDRDTVAEAAADPRGFVAQLPERVVLDEVQKVPELLPALKMVVDRERIPGRFLLTGSSHVLLVPRLTDTLAGRMMTVRLHPLSQCELAARDSGFPEALLRNHLERRCGESLDALRQASQRHKEAPTLEQRVARGGYPSVQGKSTKNRFAWFEDYLEYQVLRDVRDSSDLRRPGELLSILNYAVAQTAGLFVATRLGETLGMTLPTVGRYVSMLERVFLMERLSAWASSLHPRLIRTPKLHLGDTGLACALLRMGESSLDSSAGRKAFGPLLETFVFQELRRQLSWRAVPPRLYHFRNHDKVEVDIVLEEGIERVAGVEVKAGDDIDHGDFRGLRKLKDLAGQRFAAGAVLYGGDEYRRFGDDLHAVPLSLLWETLPEPADDEWEARYD